MGVRLEAGRDRLLEWNSLQAGPVGPRHRRHPTRGRRPDAGRVHAVCTFDLFFIEVEELAPRTYRLGSAGVLVDDFPGLKADGFSCTRDRQRALLREDLQFLTWDHPLATGALDLLLGSEKGNCSFARWPDDGGLRALSGGGLRARMPRAACPCTSIGSCRRRRCASWWTIAAGSADAVSAQALVRESRPAAGQATGFTTRYPRHAAAPTCRIARNSWSHERPEPHRTVRSHHARRVSTTRPTRLRELQKVNRTVRDEEIASLIEQQQHSRSTSDAARLRLDAVRLIPARTAALMAP